MINTLAYNIWDVVFKKQNLKATNQDIVYMSVLLSQFSYPFLPYVPKSGTFHSFPANGCINTIFFIPLVEAAK